MVEIFNNKDISIMCPKCGKFLLKADKRDTRKNKVKCRHCNKLITYVPANSTISNIEVVPERMTGSGVRFY